MLLIPLDSRFRGNDDCGINQGSPKRYNTLGIEKGAVWILFMDRADTSTECERNSFFRIIGVGDCG